MSSVRWFEPPAISTCPFCSNVAVCPARFRNIAMGPYHIRCVGIRISADASQPTLGFQPPAASTRPFASSVSVKLKRETVMFPALDQPAPSKISALDTNWRSPLIAPATSTHPLLRRTAVCEEWPRGIGLVADQVPVVGSYSSAERRTDPLLWPPATSTFPLSSGFPVWKTRG